MFVFHDPILRSVSEGCANIASGMKLLASGRALTFGPWAAYAVARYGWPRRLLSYNGGIGDDLLCTIVARELRKRQAGTIWVGTHYPELFEQNRDVRAVPLADWRFGALAPLLGADAEPLGYTHYDAASDSDPEPPLHFAAMMCRKAGITGSISVRPYLFLRQSESGQGKAADNQIAIQSAGLMRNKEWYPEGFQAVIKTLADRFTFVQLGSPRDPKLDDVIDLRGKTSLRQAAAILSKSRLFVGLAGGLMHLARAVDCPSVIVYGGRERPQISGYSCNANITNNPPCSPCWQRNRCDHDRRCMTEIAPETVIEGVKERLDSRGGELLVEVVEL